MLLWTGSLADFQHWFLLTKATGTARVASCGEAASHPSACLLRPGGCGPSTPVAVCWECQPFLGMELADEWDFRCTGYALEKEKQALGIWVGGTYDSERNFDMCKGRPLFTFRKNRSWATLFISKVWIHSLAAFVFGIGRPNKIEASVQ